MRRFTKRILTAVGLILSIGGSACWGQNTSAPKVDRASAYYHFTLAQMYATLASTSVTTASRTDYVNKAIDNLKAAIKADPATALLPAELSDLYIQTGRLRDATTDAEEAIKKNSNDVAAHRMLARVYTAQIGDSQRNRIDEAMLRRAIQEYQKVTELDAKDADAWVLLGRLQRVSMKADDAEKSFQSALKADPANEDALTGLASILADKGDNQGAAELLKKAAEKNPSAGSLQRLADAYEQIKDYGLAAETLRHALELNPENAPDLARAMAQDLVFAERFQEALEVYQELAADDPSDAQAYLRISQIYRQLRDFPKAREANDKARAIEPNNIEIRYNEVSILEAEGKATEAIRLLQDILTQTEKRAYNQTERASRIALLERLGVMQRIADHIDDAVSTYQQIAVLDPTLGPGVGKEVIETYAGGKEYAKAQQEAEAAYKKYPMDRGVRLARASLMAEMGNADAAAADVKKMLDGKDDLEIHLALAEIYEKGKKFDETSKSLDAAEKLSTGQDEKIDVWFRRGAMFERMKNVPSAEAEFRKVLAGSPDNPATLNYLGYMLADRNIRLPEALDMIQKAVNKEPNNGAYLDSLGWVYFRLNRLPEAEENMRRAVELTPHDPTMHDHYAQVLMKDSKVKEAVAQWEISLKEWQTSSPSEMDPAEVAKVQQSLATARVSLARQ
jgi:tetratricopeptide (TPR) repeat protein